MESLDFKLLKRAIGQKRIHQSVKPLYGDKSWAEDLDMVNELGAHTGCVNALNWSSSGNLLASGSDDHYINLWDYNPAVLAKPFSLNTSISTGHTGNIFSVKFMPHSGDRTIVSCAADSQIRVFDLEYSRSTSSVANESASAQSRRFSTFFPHTRWLNEPSTNAKVYRSHSDRAKRIVTESSPFIFLSCSEDGEVRQWDLRLPSSAYPPPHGARRRMGQSDTQDEYGNAPPPLISYKRYALDLNSISCTQSQPHYIALGGSHLHCFLHDRRMLGRDIGREYGQPTSRHSTPGSRNDNMMREATKCVRRFAPNNQRKMNVGDQGHITACKISDARPNELISSWSGDHIYSFDIIKSPDARDMDASRDLMSNPTRRHNESDRKRKRGTHRRSSVMPQDPSELSVMDGGGDPSESSGIRVTLSDGATRDISLNLSRQSGSASPLASADDQGQRESRRIALGVVKLRKALFGSITSAKDDNSNHTFPTVAALTRALGLASSLLVEIEDIMNSWTYPLNPSEGEVDYQNKLRYERQQTWRFVQAAGCMSRALGGRLQTASSAPDLRLVHFSRIRPAPREDRPLPSGSAFALDFLKAILLWATDDISGILHGFQAPSESRGHVRFPFTSVATDDTVAEKLCDYLLGVADAERPIIDISTNRFELAEHRAIFRSQDAAVHAFVNVLSKPNLQDKVPASVANTLTTNQDSLLECWTCRVGYSLLYDAADGVDYVTVLRAFGGTKVPVIEELENLGHAPLIASAVEEPTVTGMEFVGDTTPFTPAMSDLDREQPSAIDDEKANATLRPGSGTDDDVYSSTRPLPDDEPMDGDHDDNEVSSSEIDEAESGEDSQPLHPLFRRGASSHQIRSRASVNARVPYSSHTRVYKGHCNIRTVKDVNYYGLDDEYVVSGSDDGHFFIWDRKTCQIVNILEADGEIVNVIQGHPYEPMIACSGIDSTIKIFGPGSASRERHNAAIGMDIANPTGIAHNSLRRGGRSQRERDSQNQTESSVETSVLTDDSDAIVTANGLRSRRAISRQYEITSSNDGMRTRREVDSVITEGMLARIALVLQQGGRIPGITTEDGTIVVDQDNCTVM